MNRLDMKIKAKETIKGKVLFSFVIIFLYGIIMGLPDVFIPITAGGENGGFAAIGGLIAAIAGIFLLPVRYGVVLYFHDISNGREGKIEGFLAPYKEKFWEELIKARLIATIYTVLGTICFIIPGIYMSLKYSQIEYCFLENKQMKYREAMNRSAEIMKNNKWELVILYLSFLGWMLLIPLTLGILVVYVAPYLEATMLQFYYEKSGFNVIGEREVAGVEIVFPDIQEENHIKKEIKDDSDFWK